MTADRHAFRPSLFLLLIALSTLLAGVAACTPRDSPPVGETGGEASGEVEAMAGEHQGDRPEASEAATTEPAVEVIGNPVIYADVAGRDVTGYLARPADAEGPLPGLLVIHEWWGLNDNIRAVTRRLAGEGYVALAVDLYGGQSAETPDRARQLMEAVDQSEALENLRQARQHLAERLTATLNPTAAIAAKSTRVRGRRADMLTSWPRRGARTSLGAGRSADQDPAKRR